MTQREPSGQTRRKFLQNTAVGTAAIAAGGGLLSACGSGSEGGASGSTVIGDAAEAAPTKMGGALRLGISGGAPTDTLDPSVPVNQCDFFRVWQMYETLITNAPGEPGPVPALAEEIESNAAGDEWTFRLRQGAEFHNGKTISVEDIVFSIERNLGMETSIWNAGLSAIGFNLKSGVKKLDERTVRFKLDRPYSIMRESPIMNGRWIVPVGYDPKKPVGCGPFVYKSFTPGQESVFTPFANYWGEGPFVDELTVLDLAEDAARVNALLAGQVDAIDSVPLGEIAAVEGSSDLQLLVTETGSWRPIVMGLDKPPFDDPKVRQAFRLLVDREAFLGQAVGGQGNIANDLYTPFDPVFAADIPQRQHDPEQAKALLKSAGYDGDLSVTLVTAPIASGVVEGSEVFASQAAEVGVKVNVEKIDIATYYGKEYGNRTLTVDWYGPPINYLGIAGVTEVTGAVLNETHTSNPRFDKLYEEAMRTLDFNQRKEICVEMQEISHESGGYIIPYYPNAVDAASSKTTGWKQWPNYLGLNGWNMNYIGFV